MLGIGGNHEPCRAFLSLIMQQPTIGFSTKQQVFLDTINDGENVFLTGKAGTGKSYVVKAAIELLTKKGKNVIALAPTGVAANNIGGQTIHSMFSLRPYGMLDYASCNFIKTEKRRLLNKVDVIFIDEVSMLRPDILDAMDWTLKKNGLDGLKSKQLVFVGDLKQLPPIIDDNFRSVMMQLYKGDAFYHSLCYPDLKIKTIELDEILRQSDEAFIEALNHIREGKKHEYFRQFQNLPQRGIVLAPHNATVSEYNTRGLALLKGPEYIFDAIVDGNVKAGDFNFETKVVVKKGAKIMYLSNSKNNKLINGTLGIFNMRKGFNGDPDAYFITVGDVDFALERQKLVKIEYVLSSDGKKLELQEIGSIEQYPIRLAYALTIHKSQGLTFDEITLDLSLPCFSRGQMYTALSRVKSPEGLTIITRA